MSEEYEKNDKNKQGENGESVTGLIKEITENNWIFKILKFLKKSTKTSLINFCHWNLGLNDKNNRENDGKKYLWVDTQSILLWLLGVFFSKRKN